MTSSSLRLIQHTTSLEGFECGGADQHERRSDRVSPCPSVTVNRLGSLSDRARNGHVWFRAGSDPQSAVVGELDLAVRQPALFRKDAFDLGYLSLVLLITSCRFRHPCDLDVPFDEAAKEPCLLARRCNRERYPGIGPEDAVGDPLTPANRGAMNVTISLCGM